MNVDIGCVIGFVWQQVGGERRPTAESAILNFRSLFGRCEGQENVSLKERKREIICRYRRH
jgi:hypothetical protein